MLEKSTAEMKQTVEQLEKRIDSIDTEGMIKNLDTAGSHDSLISYSQMLLPLHKADGYYMVQKFIFRLITC